MPFQLVKYCLLVSFICLFSNVFSQLYSKHSSADHAKVKVIGSLEIYIFSEPLLPYDELFTVDLDEIQLEIPTDKEDLSGKPQKIRKLPPPQTINDKISRLVSLAKRKKESNSQASEADAIIYSGGTFAQVVRFKDQNPSKDKAGIGRVRLEEGFYLFILCEPINRIKKRKFSSWEDDIIKKRSKKIGIRIVEAESSIGTHFFQLFRYMYKRKLHKFKYKKQKGIIYSSSGRLSAFYFK